MICHFNKRDIRSDKLDLRIVAPSPSQRGVERYLARSGVGTKRYADFSNAIVSASACALRTAWMISSKGLGFHRNAENRCRPACESFSGVALSKTIGMCA